MTWTHLMACGCAGLFLANAVPHLVSGVLGRPFQTPFAKPPGRGLSSSTVNVVWGSVNAGLGYLLGIRIAHFNLRSTGDVAALALGAFLISLHAARHFGQFHGGNAAGRP